MPHRGMSPMTFVATVRPPRTTMTMIATVSTTMLLATSFMIAGLLLWRISLGCFGLRRLWLIGRDRDSISRRFGIHHRNV